MSETTTLPEGSQWRWLLVKQWHYIVADGLVKIVNSKHPEEDWDQSNMTAEQLIHEVEVGRATPCDGFGQPLPAPQAEPPNDGWFLVSETRENIPVSDSRMSNLIIGFFPDAFQNGKEGCVWMGFWWGDHATMDGSSDIRRNMTHWRPWPAPPKGVK